MVMITNQLIIIGNLVADPELRFTPSGAAVANFTIVSTPRRLNKATDEWEDGDSLFQRCSLWRTAAEHAAESLCKGDRVIAVGSIQQREWEDKEGNKRYSFDLQVDEIGPSLKFRNVEVQRVARNAEDHAWEDLPEAAPVAKPKPAKRLPKPTARKAPAAATAGQQEPPF